MKKRLVLIFFLLLAVTRIPARDEDIWAASLEKVSDIVTILKSNYYKNLDSEKLAYASIRGMLDTLDPHSYFLDPENFPRVREDYSGKFYGLGIQIQKQEDRLVVISAIESTPAWRLGIQPGDIIATINGESTKPLTSFEALQRLRGEKGTKVTITILRDGLEKPLELTITREEIPLHSVPYSFMLNEATGYIYIRNFAETTTEEFEEKIVGLAKQGMRSLILDLRGNTGGPLVQSIEISDMFLPKGARVVSIRGRNKGYDRDFSAFKDGQYEKLPLVILINQGTASASEIVSGAVMDHDRGLVVGEDSWGKGLVQNLFPLGQNTAVAITTAKYLTPSGRSIQRDYSHIDDYYLNKQVPEENREIKYTDKGRKVLGQGGISPDYAVETVLKPVVAEILIRGAFFGYARKFTRHQTELGQKFIFPEEPLPAVTAASGKILIGDSFVVNAEVIADFKAYLKTLQMDVDLQKFEEAREDVRRELEREIYGSLWGIDAGVKIYRESDPVVAKALAVMPEAAKMVE